MVRAPTRTAEAALVGTGAVVGAVVVGPTTAVLVTTTGPELLVEGLMTRVVLLQGTVVLSWTEVVEWLVVAGAEVVVTGVLVVDRVTVLIP